MFIRVANVLINLDRVVSVITGVRAEGAGGAGVVVQLDIGVSPLAPIVPDDPRLLTFDGAQAAALTAYFHAEAPDLLASPA